jgi:hypothetical protein
MVSHRSELAGANPVEYLPWSRSRYERQLYEQALIGIERLFTAALLLQIKQ